MLDFISDNLTIMLSGTTMSIIGGSITGIFYKPIGTAFLSGGNLKTKYEALAIFLASILVTSLISVNVQNFWEDYTPQLDFLFGMILIMGMIAVNTIVKKWGYRDEKSYTVYAIGILIIILEPFANFKFLL